MTIEKALRSSGLDRLDAELLLAHLLGKNRTWLLMNAEQPLAPVQERQWEGLRARRAAGEPVAYIVGEKEFYGRPFTVTPDVLIPRPATEGLVDLALEFLGAPHDDVRPLDHQIVGVAKPLLESDVTMVADVGTGSGCIAVTLALLAPSLRIIATDISKEALRIAIHNAERHGVAERITFLHGSGLEPLMGLDEHFVVVSNPPYIPQHHQLMRDVAGFEPHAALFGGEDGAQVLRSLVEAATEHPYCVGYVVECRADQAHLVASAD